MGVQITNTLSGQTNGTIITIDYTADFAALTQSIQGLTTALTTTLNTVAGPAGISTTGTLSNEAGKQTQALADLNILVKQLAESSDETTQILTALQFAMSGVGSTISEGVATQQMALINDLETSEFQKEAAKDALKRNDIPEPTTRPASELVNEAANNASAVQESAAVTGFVSSKISLGAQYAASNAFNWVRQSVVGEYLAASWATVRSCS